MIELWINHGSLYVLLNNMFVRVTNMLVSGRMSAGSFMSLKEAFFADSESREKAPRSKEIANGPRCVLTVVEHLPARLLAFLYG